MHYYDEDGRVKQIYNEYARLFRDYTYGSLPLVTKRATHSYGNMLLQESFTYRKPANGYMSGQVETHRFEALNYNVTYSYTYDDNGNITSISDGAHTTSYVYDAANQLIRENNPKGGFTYIWTYDDVGNILSRTEYAYTTGSVGALRDTVTYTYGNASNKDILTAYDGAAFTRDAIGNPLSDGTRTYTWEQGRQLKSMSDGTTTWNYTYNADGMRTSRTNGSKTYEYIYNGSQLSRMTISENGTTTTYDFTYDAEGAMVLTVNGDARYIYVKNLQGDIIAILDAERTAIVEYTYDAWGNIISIEGSAKDSLGEANPLRYRGYVYDIETGLYYLQSRYYNPEMGRFINADGYASTGQGVLGNNMFAYCGNNPVIRIDQTGQFWKDLLDAFVQTLQQAKGYFVFSAGVSQLDTALPGPADLVSVGLIVLEIGGCAGIATHNALTAVSTTKSKSKTKEEIGIISKMVLIIIQ